MTANVNETEIVAVERQAAVAAKSFVNLAEAIEDCSGLDATLLERAQALLDSMKRINQRHNELSE